MSRPEEMLRTLEGKFDLVRGANSVLGLMELQLESMEEDGIISEQIAKTLRTYMGAAQDNLKKVIYE